jgi:uncharacterized membrane protein YiaA
MTTRQKAARERAEDKTIQAIYLERCAGEQIGILRIPVLFSKARAMLRADRTYGEIGDMMVAFVAEEI